MRDEVGEDRGSSGQGVERVFLAELQVSGFTASVGASGRGGETSFL